MISITSKASKVRVVFQVARYSSSGWRGFDCKASCTKRSEEEEEGSDESSDDGEMAKKQPTVMKSASGRVIKKPKLDLDEPCSSKKTALAQR